MPAGFEPRELPEPFRFETSREDAGKPEDRGVRWAYQSSAPGFVDG